MQHRLGDSQSERPGGLQVDDKVERSRQFDWQVGASRYGGTGRLDGNLLTVDWGSKQPVVYALGLDGGLRGLWADGQGEDILTPDR